MRALIAHEFRATRPAAPRLLWLAVAPLSAAVWILSSPQWQLGLLVGLAVAEGCVMCSAIVHGMSAVRREWRDGTGHLWLRLRPCAAARMGAKAIAVLVRCAVWFLGVAVLGVIVVVAYHGQLAGQGLGAVLGTAPTARTAFAVAMHWLPRDLGLTFAFVPPLVSLSLAGELPAAGTRSERRRRWRAATAMRWVAFWVLFWVAVRVLGPHVPALFAVVHRIGGTTIVHFTPAGPADVAVQVWPHMAVTLWPLFVLWAGGAAAYTVGAWYLSARAARA